VGASLEREGVFLSRHKTRNDQNEDDASDHGEMRCAITRIYGRRATKVDHVGPHVFSPLQEQTNMNAGEPIDATPFLFLHTIDTFLALC